MRYFTISKTLFLVLAFLLISCTAFAGDEDAAKITDIQIKGNKKIETETVRSRMEEKVGDVFSPSRIRADIETIYKMGYFDDVQVEAEGYAGGLRLIFNVVERPIIRSFTFEGNKEYDESKLREKITLTAYSVYNPALVSENADRLKLFYQDEGYYNAEVLPIINEVSKNEVKVVFKVTEGEKIVICDIEFTGNENIGSGKIGKAMATKEHWFLWSWIMKTGTYKSAEFINDIERIKALYYNNGYIQVSVGEPEVVLNEDKSCLKITIPIHEGEQFNFGKVEFSGNTIIPTEDMREQLKMEEGEVMNRDLLRDDIVRLTDLYGSKGYAFATITPVINPNVETKTVDITLDVSEGDQIYVDRINITGNDKTRDKVIRRELKMNEGEIYDTSSIKGSYDRLKNLDFFEEVEIVPERKGETNTVDLDVKVKEKSTGSFSIGGGYSTVDRLVAIGEVTQNNFLGMGELLKFKGEFGARRQNFVFSFMEPWLFDRPISLKVDLYKEERVYTSYSERSTGGSLSVGRRFWDYYGVTGSFAYYKQSYFDVEDLTAQVNANQVIIEDPDVTQFTNLDTVSKFGLSLTRDSRDNYLDTRRGSNNSIYMEVASTLTGSQAAYYKAIGDTTWYFPFPWETAFSLHGRVGYAKGLDGKELPLNERFLIGGISTLRGFDWGAVGPKSTLTTFNVDPGDPTNRLKWTDPVTSEGRFLGGYKELIINAEYTFPVLPSIKLRGVAFLDAGNAYDANEGFGGSLRYSAGGGFRWLSPMGLIRLEYGKILDKQEGESGGKWEFSMGSMF